MRGHTMLMLSAFLASLALAGVAQDSTQPPAIPPLPVHPQEGGIRQGPGGEHEPGTHPPTGGTDAGEMVVPSGRDQGQREMIELFGKVERKLREIDALLADAGSGRNTSRVADLQEAGIGDLLQRSLATGRSTLDDIDRILELAAAMGAQQQGQSQSQSECESCKSGSCNKPGHGQSGLLERGQQSSQREQTPEGPNGEKPGDEGKEKPADGGQPDSPREGVDENPENAEGQDPPAGATEAPARPAHAGERWGDLPVHTQDIFRTEGDRHMPARYRDWIDAYYRKLSARAERR